jgi:hypothetical protein
MSFTLKLGNDFLCILRLPADGKGFVVWKERLEFSIWARGLYGHLDGTVTKPQEPTRPAEGATATAEQVSAVERYTKDLNQYLQEQAIVFQQIASTIPDLLYLKIKGKVTVKEAWDTLKADFEKRSWMIIIDLQKRLQDVRCAENGNIRTHFDNIRTMREELASLGMTLSEPDFSAIVLGSLPKSYDQFLSAVTATASVLKQELDLEDLMQTIIDEYNQWSTRSGAPKDKNSDAAFFAGENKGGKAGKRSDKDVKCYNCHRKGYKKADCWAKGGGKEGQGPRTKAKKDKKELKKDLKKDSANIAGGEEDGVWMAIANNSGDEDMADNKFDDFTISDDDLFFFEDEDKDGNILDLTTRLKRLLKISDPAKHATYPYDNFPDYFLDARNFTDSSDDEQGAVAMKVSSESDNKVKIDPYWSNIKVDELQNLRNPMELLFKDTDSMPDLESMSKSENSEELVIFVLTSANSSCDTGLEKVLKEVLLCSLMKRWLSWLLMKRRMDLPLLTPPCS